VNQGLRYAGESRPVSLFPIPISLLDLPISLAEMGKWKEGLPISPSKIGNPSEEIGISFSDLPISLQETQSAFSKFTPCQLALHRRTCPKPSVEESPTLLFNAT